MSKELEDDSKLILSGDLVPESSRLSATVFVFLLVVPIVLTVLYGAVDYWALGLQAVFSTIILGLWVADSISRGELRFSANRLQLPLIGMALIGLVQLLPFRDVSGLQGGLSETLSAALTLNPFATRFAVVQLLAYIVFFGAALVYIDSPKRLRGAVVTFLIFTSLMAFFGILQFLAKPEAIYGLRPTPQAAPFSSFVNRHHFAALMEMTFGVALALLAGKSTARDKRYLLITVIILSGVACILTGSRGGLLSLFGVSALVLLAEALLRRKHKDSEHDRAERGMIFSRKFSTLFGSLAVLVVVIGTVLLLGGDSSLTRGLGLTSQQDFSSGRLHFWAVTWNVFLANPVLGVGLDSLGSAFTMYDSWPGLFRIEHAHNEYLQVLAEAGIPGLLSVIAFIVILSRTAVSAIASMTDLFPRGLAVGALAGCFGIILHSFFDFPLRTPANAYFFLLMTVFATAGLKFRTSRHKRRNKPDLMDQY